MLLFYIYVLVIVILPQPGALQHVVSHTDCCGKANIPGRQVCETRVNSRGLPVTSRPEIGCRETKDDITVWKV